MAVLLIAVQATYAWTASGLPTGSPWLWLLTTCYLVFALFGWAMLHHTPPAMVWRWPWLVLLAADVLTICLVQELQMGKMHYTPLLALPILTVSVLGHMRIALATTASTTLVLLAIDVCRGWLHSSVQGERYMQTALVCTGFFAVAYLTRQLAQRLAEQEQQARTNRQAARTQAQVNGLIIANLSEGVLVVDSNYRVHMANPAACELLNLPAAMGLHNLQDRNWQALRDMVDQTFASHQALSQHIHLMSDHQSPTGLFVRTWLTASLADEVLLPELDDDDADGVQASQVWLCVMFLHDLRETEARLRTEKMAAMGRMSAAVAHEIRNPLAAIVQANGLLAEELTEPTQRSLCQMVEHNAQRLARIAEEVLDIARVQQQIQYSESRSLALDNALKDIWQEWRQHNAKVAQGVLLLDCATAQVVFDDEHLRRVVVNLLDNAARHCQGLHPDALQLISGSRGDEQFWFQVWSEGPPLEASVQKHLFEPFFSSQSRSTGLGLFICRELCQRHGGSIHYSRCERSTAQGLQSGNAFTVHLRGQRTQLAHPSLFDAIVV